MKRFLRCVSLFLVMAMLLSIPAFAQTREEVSTWSSAFFMRHLQYLYKITSVQFEVWFEVTAVSGMDELGASVIKVQRSANGTSGWETTKTYYKENYSQMICKDTCAHTACVSYVGTPGYYYRALITYYAKNSSGIGKYSLYTSTMQL